MIGCDFILRPLWLLESIGMTEPESKKENNEAIPKQSAENRIVSDIEEALNFLDSEEYQEESQPVSRIKPSPSKIAPVQSPRPTDATPIRPQHNMASNIQKIKQEPIKNPSTPTTGKKESGKRWVLYLGGIVILLAIFMLYKMGYSVRIRLDSISH